ncbi:MAG: hypothetical protein WAV51_04095 [Microgenomates group bacterium]
MPTTDTFIIPPMQPEAAPTKEKPAKKKVSGGKTILLVGLVLLIITLPVAIYYITQQQQLADTRSRASGATGNQCSKGDTRCQTNANGTNTGYICKCVNVTDSTGADVMQWGCGSRSDSCPTGTSNTSGSTAGTRTTPYGYAGGCGYIQKPPLSGNKPCNEETCGMNCGVFTGDCGNLCFDQSCAAAGCASGGGVGAKEETATAEATATPEPTATQTPAPTSAPNSATCDASCSSDNNCASGLTCSSVDGINRCRNASCPAESTCNCPEATSAPVQDSTDTTGEAMPISGVGPGVIGSITAIGSILLLIAGLAL